jgi:hypothetical protein
MPPAVTWLERTFAAEIISSTSFLTFPASACKRLTLAAFVQAGRVSRAKLTMASLPVSRKFCAAPSRGASLLAYRARLKVTDV